MHNTELKFEDMKHGIDKAGGLFYQYRPCRRDVATIYDIENIRHGVVYAQTPLNMNDPFDSMIGYSPEKMYENCISMLVEELNIEDESFKFIISQFLKYKAVGKLAEFICMLNDLKKYLFSRQVSMHQVNVPIIIFIRQNLNTLYAKCPKKIKGVLSKEVFAAFLLIVSDMESVNISDTVISLYMENPVKFIGYVRREDIKFDVKMCETRKLPQTVYESKKTEAMSSRIVKWLAEKEKTIVYFPYAQNAFDASRGVRGFAGIKTDPRIGVFTGKNVDELSTETFNEKKRETFEKFRTGEQSIMYATKAFGMGVDIDDVQNVYHYAVSGNLCDYIQEIGRVARKPEMTGVAITDFFYNDMTYMNKLFGMSRIRQYQIKKVLEGIYDVYKSKKGARSFLISPQSFTYIFNGKGVKDEGQCINKLKTCLLMLEKDFYDKYNFKVIISRPQSVFTKAYVVIDKENESLVLNSEYGKCFRFLARGRYQERQPDGSLLSDTGDVYTLDLKQVWEQFHGNISFPQFKYWYFNDSSTSKDKIAIMPSIRKYFSPRQKVNIEARGDLLLNEIREKILADFEYIGNILYSEFGKNYFTTDDFTRVIKEKYGMTQARIIANSLFDLVDPNMTCVKRRSNDSSAKNYYLLSNGNFKEYMRKAIIKSLIVNKITTADHILSGFKKKGWIAYRIYEVDMEEISEVLK